MSGYISCVWSIKPNLGQVKSPHSQLLLPPCQCWRCLLMAVWLFQRRHHPADACGTWRQACARKTHHAATRQHGTTTTHRRSRRGPGLRSACDLASWYRAGMGSDLMVTCRVTLVLCLSGMSSVVWMTLCGPVVPKAQLNETGPGYWDCCQTPGDELSEDASILTTAVSPVNLSLSGWWNTLQSFGS